MRFVLCDEDQFLRSMVESLVTRHGHDVVGCAEDTASAVLLLETARPDAVIVDLALGYNTDFDVLATAVAVEARTIVFSHTADDELLRRYDPKPIVVEKPDLTALELVLERLAATTGPGSDRRRRPPTPPRGPQPSGITDVQAFFEAFNNAVVDDALVFVELPEDGFAEGVAAHLVPIIRATDRLLASPQAVKVFLADSGDEGTDAVVERVRGELHLPAGTTVHSVVVADGELPADAFDRLRDSGRQHDV